MHRAYRSVNRHDYNIVTINNHISSYTPMYEITDDTITAQMDITVHAKQERKQTLWKK